MKRLIGLAMAALVMGGSTLAAGGVYITIDSPQGQVTQAAAPWEAVYITIDSPQGQIKGLTEIFYSVKSPRDLANRQTASVAATSGQASVAATASAGREGMRRPVVNDPDPVVIYRYQDGASKFLGQQSQQGNYQQLLPAVVFEFTRALGNGRIEVYQTVRLTNAVVSSAETLYGPNNPYGAVRDMERVFFRFQKIEYQNKDGAPAAPDSWDWKKQYIRK